MNYVQLSLLLFSSSVLFELTRCEFYTALTDMKKLLLTQNKIVKGLNKYLIQEREILMNVTDVFEHAEELQNFKKVKWLYTQYEDLYNLAKKNVNEFIVNPVNGFLLIKRLTSDWSIMKKMIARTKSKEVIKTVLKQKIRFPDKEDLSGSAQAIIRLQDIYLLNAEDIARGTINGVQQSVKLTASDCYELGLQAYAVRDLKRTISWMQEYYRRAETDEIKTVDKLEFLEYMSIAYYGLKNYRAAIDYAEDILALDPNHERAKMNLPIYQEKRAIQKQNKETATSSTEEEDLNPEIFKKGENMLDPSITNAYKKLCRGESLKTEEEKRKLTCFYTHGNNAFLLLQPVKMEVLSWNPELVMYYDVINDKEAQILKTKAASKLDRAKVVDEKSGQLEVANNRISKCAWLFDDEDPSFGGLTRRIGDITGLDNENSEPLHILNYGLGGHYEPHFDYSAPGVKSFTKGNRIATWIFYLSDVAMGGSTVFPNIGVEVKPIKGAAAFWYNLHRNGTGDENTRHAACPVLIGSKWVANKWIHEKGNEFRRPCTLNQHE